MNIRYIVYILFALLASVIPILMLIHSLKKEKFGFVQFDETGILRHDWSRCMELNADKMENTTWIQWPTILNYCEKYLTDNVTTVDVASGLAVVRFLYNKTHHDFAPKILVLAEGIKAESIEKIRERLIWDNMTFIGTEPADVANYTDVGVFFPESDEPEEEDSRLSPIDFPRPLTKTKRRVGRKEFIEFLTTYKLKFYDAIWLDWAVKDYEVLPLTYRGDLLDELGITVCQFHVLVHYGSKVQEIHEFITRTIQEKRYAILRAMPSGTIANSDKFPFAVPVTLYMINIENQECGRMAAVSGTEPVYSAKPYLHLYFSDIATLQLSITTFLLLCAAVNVNRETNLSEVNNHRRTIWAIEHHKVAPDGTKYYNYTDPMTGETTNAAPGRVWFDEIIKGKFVYMFGTSFNTFCWPRIVPVAEWFRSIYRSTQLTPWVQVPLKAAVLFGMALRIVNALIFSAVKNSKDPKPTFGKYFAWIVVYNEIFHNTCLFLLSNYLKDPDSQYFYLFRPAFITAYVTFIIKMFSSFWHTGFNTLTYFRIIQGIVMATTFTPNYTNIMAYLDHNYCDNYTTPMVGIYEWAALICLWGAEVMDTVQCSEYDIIFVKNYCEEEQEMEMNGVAL